MLQKLFLAISLVCVLSPSFILALPQLERNLEGNYSIDDYGKELVITQSTNFASGLWRDFNVAADESVRFVQPDNGLYLARVSGYGSIIEGSITANANLIIANPAGIQFTASSVVNVGGLLAVAGSLEPASLSDPTRWNARVTGGILSDGAITANSHEIAFIAREFFNSGEITNNNGGITIVSARLVYIELSSDSVIVESIEGLDSLDVESSLIVNSGLIRTNKNIVIRAYNNAAVYANIVNVSGVVSANSIELDINGNAILLGRDALGLGSFSAGINSSTTNPFDDLSNPIFSPPDAQTPNPADVEMPDLTAMSPPDAQMPNPADVEMPDLTERNPIMNMMPVVVGDSPDETSNIKVLIFLHKIAGRRRADKHTQTPSHAVLSRNSKGKLHFSACSGGDNIFRSLVCGYNYSYGR